MAKLALSQISFVDNNKTSIFIILDLTSLDPSSKGNLALFINVLLFSTPVPGCAGAPAASLAADWLT